MENHDMLNDFYIEVEELFSEAEDSLFGIESTDSFEQSFNSVFRAFHSVNGAAGMFGFEKLQQHMHYVEDLLEK
jgi:two-component system chemotaxis sensor kinase CheA